MRIVSILSVLAGIGLANCTANSVDCTLGTPHSDCAPNTFGHKAAMEELRSTQMTNNIDDARCQSYGFRPGSPEYTRCRANFDNQRMPVGH
jgi:hypothetical protein